MNRLLPCPFCGSSNVRLDNLTDSDDYFVSCEDCEVQQIANYLPDVAAERWNRRAVSCTTSQVELLEALRGMFQLVTDDILVRNIARDSESGEYYANAAKLVLGLKKAELALAKAVSNA